MLKKQYSKISKEDINTIWYWSCDSYTNMDMLRYDLIRSILESYNYPCDKDACDTFFEYLNSIIDLGICQNWRDSTMPYLNKLFQKIL